MQTGLRGFSARENQLEERTRDRREAQGEEEEVGSHAFGCSGFNKIGRILS